MAEKQYRITITYNDDTTEEYVIHSDETVEWINPAKTQNRTRLPLPLQQHQPSSPMVQKQRR